MQHTGTVSQRDIFDTFDTWLASHKIQDLRTETQRHVWMQYIHRLLASLHTNCIPFLPSIRPFCVKISLFRWACCVNTCSHTACRAISRSSSTTNTHHNDIYIWQLIFSRQNIKSIPYGASLVYHTARCTSRYLYIMCKLFSPFFIDNNNISICDELIPNVHGTTCRWHDLVSFLRHHCSKCVCMRVHVCVRIICERVHLFTCACVKINLFGLCYIACVCTC
jgi:hypothetical protein